MSVFTDARVDIAGKLTAAGLTVTLDPRAPLPCVLVDAPTVESAAGVGGWSVIVPVQIIAPPPGGADALVWLLDALEMVLTVYPAAMPAVPTTITRNDQDCPAYTVPVAAAVTNPNC
ncbi:MAG: hypothetical protein EHM90_00005 [Chloroflexi bacterium]|nr:MAG: hypothetical protein EHM90_00005 [Chloroflexota bacterium]